MRSDANERKERKGWKTPDSIRRNTKKAILKKGEIMAIEVKSSSPTIASLSGRLGNFVFRDMGGRKMLVFYQPKRKKGEKEVPITDRQWSDNGPIMAEFEEYAKMFHLEIVKKV